MKKLYIELDKKTNTKKTFNKSGDNKIYRVKKEKTKEEIKKVKK